MAMFKSLLLVLFGCLVFQQKSLGEESYGYSRNPAFPTFPCPSDQFVNETGFPLNSTINCTSVIPPELRQLKCERFPDVENDPLPCAERNYKVLAINLTEQSRTQIAVHAWLASYSSVINEECLNNISNMICKTVAPACDRNETMVVELVSRQDCEKIISCLNTTSSSVANLRVNMMERCKFSPDANTANTTIPLSLVYIEFEDNVTPKTYSNDTKISPTLTTQSTISLNKTQPTQNVTGESDSPNTPTQRPFINSTDQHREEATMSVNSSPTTQANLTIPNPKSTTKKPTVNATYQEKKEAKSVPNLPPTTTLLSSLNYTTHSQNKTELPTTRKINTTSSLVFNRDNRRNKTTENPGTNRPHSKAAQFNKKLNVLAFLLISFLSIMCT